MGQSSAHWHDVVHTGSASGTISRKDTDEFGNTRLVKRANAARAPGMPASCTRPGHDSVREILARMHGLPALWLGDDNEASAPTSR